MYEVTTIIESTAEKLEYDLKLKLEGDYELAQNIAIAVCARLGGKKPPTLQETYPTLFSTAEQVKVEDRPQAWEIYREQFLDFANLHNKNRKKKEG